MQTVTFRFSAASAVVPGLKGTITSVGFSSLEAAEDSMYLFLGNVSAPSALPGQKVVSGNSVEGPMIAGALLKTGDSQVQVPVQQPIDEKSVVTFIATSGNCFVTVQTS